MVVSGNISYYEFINLIEKFYKNDNPQTPSTRQNTRSLSSGGFASPVDSEKIRNDIEQRQSDESKMDR